MEKETIVDEGENRLEVDARLTSHAQQSKVPQQKKALHIGTPHSKLVPDLTVDDVKDMYAMHTTIVVCKHMRSKGKKLHSNYAHE